MDGEIARATLRSSRAGAFVDAVLDRVADVAILAGLAVAAGLSTEIWVVLVLAVMGSLLLPYSAAVYRHSFGHPPPAWFTRVRFGRDARLLVAAVSALALHPAWGLFAIVLIDNAVVTRRVIGLLRTRA